MHENPSQIPSPTAHKPAFSAAGRSSWSLTIGVVVMLSAALLGLAFLLGFPDMGEDSYSYRALALGQWAQVHQPFSARFLHPVLVQGLAHLTHRPVDTIFLAVDVVCVPVTVFALATLLRRLAIPVLLLVPAVLGASLVQSIQLAFMPDLFYTLLLSGFLILLAEDQIGLAAGGVVVLFCARESTLVLGAVLVVLGRRAFPRRGGRLASLFAVATLVGFLLNRHVTNMSAGNMHHITGLTYMLGKVPYNFTKNILGIQVWFNTLIQTQGNHPMVRYSLPHRLQMGGISEVGISEISPLFPLRWLLSSACTFGVLLTVLLHAGRRAWIEAGPRPWLARARRVFALLAADQPFVLRVAGAYGIISFILVPVLGTATHRYVYYAWPAFWLTALALFVRNYLPESAPALARAGHLLIALLVVHAVLIWLPVVPTPGMGPVLAVGGALGVAVILHIIAFTLLARLLTRQNSDALAALAPA
jgi:hypothetical protein